VTSTISRRWHICVWKRQNEKRNRRMNFENKRWKATKGINIKILYKLEE
jgi:hypothetical protein